MITTRKNSNDKNINDKSQVNVVQFYNDSKSVKRKF